MAKNMIIGQSGGPTAVINASLAGAIDYAFRYTDIDTVYGMVHGIQGLLEDNVKNLTEHFANRPSRLNRLSMTPAMFLGSCRFKLSGDKDEYERIIKALKKYDIGYFLYIGGNDSMDTVEKLSKYVEENDIDIKVVGIPKTIDNDLVGIDHSPGFASAAKYVALAVRNVTYDTAIYSSKSVHIIEAMGRDAGWLAAASVLSRDSKNVAPILFIFRRLRFLLKNLLAM